MCLKTTDLMPKKAEKDIVCYKLLYKLFKGDYYTPYRFEKITPLQDNGDLTGVRQSTCFDNAEISLVCQDFAYIDSGFIHTYRDKEYALSILKKHNIHYCIDTYRLQLHAYIYECIIPAGKCYFEGCNHDYASETIIYKGQVLNLGEELKVEEYARTFYSIALRVGFRHGNKFSPYLCSKMVDYYIPDMENLYDEGLKIANGVSCDIDFFLCLSSYVTEHFETVEDFMTFVTFTWFVSGIVYKDEFLKKTDIKGLIQMIKEIYAGITWDEINVISTYNSEYKLQGIYKRPVDAIVPLFFQSHLLGIDNINVFNGTIEYGLLIDLRDIACNKLMAKI